MIIFINGPPGSGKDEAADIIRRRVHRSVTVRLSSPLKRGLQELLGLDFQEWNEMLRQGNKDKPITFHSNVTTRQALIKLSEEYLKPIFGKDIFGQIAVRKMRGLAASHYILDIGFNEELVPILDKYSRGNCRLLRLSRPGCSFDNDSRYYVDVDMLGLGPFWCKIHNEHDKDIFEAQIVKVLRQWKLLPKAELE